MVRCDPQRLKAALLDLTSNALEAMIAGFGRAGRYWGIDHSQVRPDIITLGKSFEGLLTDDRHRLLVPLARGESRALLVRTVRRHGRDRVRHHRRGRPAVGTRGVGASQAAKTRHSVSR